MRSEGPRLKWLGDLRGACEMWYGAKNEADRAAALARVEELAGSGATATLAPALLTASAAAPAAAPPAAAVPPAAASASASASLIALLAYYSLAAYAPILAETLGIYDVADVALLSDADVARVPMKPIHRAKLMSVVREVRSTEASDADVARAVPGAPASVSSPASAPPLPSWPPQSPAARRRADLLPSPSPRVRRARPRQSRAAATAAAAAQSALTLSTQPALVPMGAFVLVRNVRFRPDLVNALYAERTLARGSGGSSSSSELGKAAFAALRLSMERDRRDAANAIFRDVPMGNPNPRYWLGRVTKLVANAPRAVLQLYDESPVGSGDFGHTARTFEVELAAVYPLAAGQMEFHGGRRCWHCSPSPLWAGDEIVPVPQRLSETLRAATSMVEISASIAASPALRSLDPSPPTLTHLMQAMQTAVSIALGVGEGAFVGVRPLTDDAPRGGSRLWSTSLSDSSALHASYTGAPQILKLGSLHALSVVITCYSLTPDGRVRAALALPGWRDGSAADLAALVERTLCESAPLRSELERWGYDLVSSGHCAVTAARSVGIF